MAKAQTSKDPSFEEALGFLESTLAKLQEGHLPLEQALADYEACMTTYRQCEKLLSRAEQRILKLKDPDAVMAEAEKSASPGDVVDRNLALFDVEDDSSGT